MEDMLTECNLNSCILERVKRDTQVKNVVNSYTYKLYERKLFRKLKWYSFINKQKTEDRMINNFKNTYGNPKDTVICIGDWGQSTTIKFKESSRNGTLKIFRKHGYDVFLVDEYNTSKKYYKDGTNLEKFWRVTNPRPWRKNEEITRHGLLRTRCIPNKYY